MLSSSHAASLYYYCALVFFASLMLLSSSPRAHTLANGSDTDAVKGSQLLERHCDEIYVVGEGETLHTIASKCGDPFIVERNPHVHDPDDVFPGLVLKIAPSLRSRN